MIVRARNLMIVFAFLSVFLMSGFVYAQDDTGENKIEVTQTEKSEGKPSGLLSEPESVVSKIPSLFFTFWQHQSIRDAKNSRGLVRPPTQAELDALRNGDDLKPKPEEREISLGGIVYTKAGDWTIWLNGKRVTPDALPSEILDLHVYKDYIEFKWLDDYTNRIFPIRLRSHQRFNLDQRIFLPG